MAIRSAWLVVVSTWALIGLVLTRLQYRWHASLDSPITTGQSAARGMGDAFLWALVTLLVIEVSRRFPLGRERTGRALALHSAAALGLPLIRFAAYGWVASAAGGVPPSDVPLIEIFGPYLLIVAVISGVAYAGANSERALKSQRLQAELATARLHQLKAQLHPHFLFNTLNSISSLMYSDVRAADRMLTQLADLLRRSLRTLDVQKVPLREEMDFLLAYLDIERARLGARMKVDVDLAPGLEMALVPHLLLQPLVENAIRHGMAPRALGGCLQLRIETKGERLIIEVADDGPGASEATIEAAEGIGIRNTRARLAALYADNHRMEIESTSEGMTVRVALPLEICSEQNPMSVPA